MGKIKVFGIIMIAVLLSNCSSDDGGVNTAPEVQNLNLVYDSSATQGGEIVLVSGSVLTAEYTYSDVESDTEGNTTFNWYRSDDTNGANKELVSNATEATYTITSADADKYLSVEVTPVQSDGVSGKAVSSGYSPLAVNFVATWDGESVTTYEIVNGEFIKTYDHPVDAEYLSLQQDTAKHQEIIAQFKKIVPEAFFDRINNFTLYLGELGEQNTLGRVFYSINQRNVFDFEIAIDNAYAVPFNNELGLNYTIAHEFGHVLTLDDTQASTTIFDENNCDNFFFGTCFYSDSYLNVFYQNYWVPILTDYNNSINYRRYYAANPTQFVSEYAASQPTEDIAETFMMYVLNSVNFTGTTVADQKVNSMNNYTDFQTVRTFATTNIPNSSLRSVSFDGSKRGEFSCGTRLHKH
ncbi:5'-nucleotidase [Flavobacteriaceae bacterium UJ101]|nr:5'-nucleotidase [Flavobacteriaceae bacterium UJ101]